MNEFVYKLYTRWDFISLETMAKFKWENWHVIVMDFKNIKVYFTMSSKYTKNIIATCYEFKNFKIFTGLGTVYILNFFIIIVILYPHD